MNADDTIDDTIDATDEASETFSPNWASDAPRGGRTVLNRILKESATVPLFFAQTIVQSLRDVGYNTTTSALCEHVDNALEGGASEIRIYFRQHGRKGAYDTDILVYDNGRGMPPNVLKVATSFGGSMSFGNRKGIGRFGMGMKTAALSISPVMELYSWQEPRAFYNMTLDTVAIGRDTKNLVALPEPTYSETLPVPVADMFTRAMGFPKDITEQELLAPSDTDVYQQVGPHGTIVFMPDCDRLTYARDKTLVDDCVKEMARVYRRQIARGIRIYVNNRITQAVDPTYSIESARHTWVEGLKTKTSRLIVARTVPVPLNDKTAETAPVHVKVYALPIDEWSRLPRKVQSSNLQLFDGHVVSILRNDREVYAGYVSGLVQKHGETHWLRVEIDFSGELDEAFGVASNKQGVRLKSYVTEAISNAIDGDITFVRQEIRRVQARNAVQKAGANPSTSEQRATEADIFQSEKLDTALTEDQKLQMEANLRGLAIGLKRDGESDEEAYQRVMASNYLITFRDDPYWPFYHVEQKFGRVILTINSAHPFFSELYKPLRELEIKEEIDSEGGTLSSSSVPLSKGPMIALELLLLSLARTQSIMSRGNPDVQSTLESLTRGWSDSYRVQLSAPGQ